MLKSLRRCLHLTVQRAASGRFFPRPPVVTIMGHVDHGKTTLLDHLRNSQIVKQEFGGITQHIGAFVVPFKHLDKKELVTFLDTPGHAAFSSMRQRGANITDIVILVIACEDGVLDQTIESIGHAKASEVPIIVAINKVDKFPNKNDLEQRIETIRNELRVHDVVTEADGGDVQLVKISALHGIGVDDLKESLLAQAETLELKAEMDCPMQGRVVESKLDPHRGKMCTVLVQRGRLVKGSSVVAGSGRNWAKVRSLFDERGHVTQSCDPGLPILVTGWRGDHLPSPGDVIDEVKNETEAKAIAMAFKEEQDRIRALQDAEEASKRAEEYQKVYKEKLIEKQKSGFVYRPVRYCERGVRLKEIVDDENRDRKLNLVLKCDVDGSLEALLEILDTYDPHNNQLVQLDLLHYGVGDISDNDLIMASSFKGSVIYGFNVKPSNQKILIKAKQDGVPLKIFNVIYHLIDDLKLRMTEKLPELERHEEFGRASVIEEFVISEKGKKKFHVAGCKCTKGSFTRSLEYKLLRNNELIAKDMKVKTLKHFKDDVNEILKGRECGISFEGNENLEFKPGDILIGYERGKFKPKLKWDLKGFS